jgi:CBS domain-containing protein
MKSVSNLQLRDIASSDVCTVTPDSPLDAAVRQFAEHRVSALVVVEAGKPVGIVTERELVRLIGESSLDSRSIREVMTAPVLTAGDDLDFSDARILMKSQGARDVVLVDATGVVVGVVNQHPVLDRLGESSDKLAGCLEVVLEATGIGTWEYDHRNGIVTRGGTLNKLFQFPVGKQHDTLGDILQRIDPDDRAVAQAVFDDVKSGRVGQFSVDYRELGGDGETRWVSVRGRVVESDEQGLPLRIVGATIDLTERRQEQALLELSNAILQRISTAAPLAEVFDLIAREIEHREPGTLCSILLLDEDGQTLTHGAGPSLPPDFLAAIDGARIGPQAGSCGTAAYRKAPVFVADIATDPLWADYRDLAIPHDLAACWSSPIFAVSGAVLGTFAIYWRTPHPVVSLIVRRHVEMATRLVGIAIENAQREAKLQGMLDELRRWQHLTLGREGRVLELKREVNALLGRLGEAPAYPSVLEGGEAT